MKPAIVIALILLATAPSWGQTAPPEAPEVKLPDPVTITLSRERLQQIGNGVMKLPYDVAAPLLQDLQGQINAIDSKARAEQVQKKGPPGEGIPGGPSSGH